jgi:hypothetical protein
LVSRTADILFITFILCHCILCSQKVMEKVVVDSATKEKLSFVSVKTNLNEVSFLTGKQGSFRFISSDVLKHFVFYKIGYQEKIVSYKELYSIDTIVLAQKAIQLSEVSISSEKTEAIIKDKRSYVDDYVVLKDGSLLYITSRINSPDFHVVYRPPDSDIQYKRTVSGEGGGSLVQDCFGNVQLLTDKFSRQIYFDSGKSFEFLKSYDRRVYDQTLANSLLVLNSGVITSTQRNPQYQSLVSHDVKIPAQELYFLKNTVTGSEKFYTVRFNKALREMAENELRDWNLMGKQVDNKTQANIDVFYHSVAKEIYAPIFMYRDTVVLFDFQELEIVFLSENGEILKKSAINKKDFPLFHEITVLQDQVSRKFYVCGKQKEQFQLKEILINSGNAGAAIKLEKPFPKKVTITNGNIYYLVREKSWDDTAYLYRQK